MTVSTTSNKVILLGNGATTVWSFNFPGVDVTDIQVYYTDTLGNITLLNLTQYTIQLNAPIDPNPTGVGGTVTYPLSGSPIANGTSLTIFRDLPEVQETSLANQGTMYPKVIELALDYLTMLVQQLQELFGRAITVAVSDPPITPLPSAAQRANLLLGFDNNGNPIASAVIPNAIVSSAMIPVVSASTTALARELLGVFVPFVMLEEFGGGTVASGITDNTAAMSAILAAAAGGSVALYLGVGTYQFQSTITINMVASPGSFTIAGMGQDVSVLHFPSTDGIKFNATAAQHSIHLRDFSLTTHGSTQVGLRLNNSVALGDFGQSDIFRVTLRGAPVGLFWWGTGIQVNGLSAINFDTVLYFGSSANSGIALDLQRSSHTPFYGIQYNLVSCAFYNAGIGIQYGDFIQGVTCTGCNFGGITGIFQTTGIGAEDIQLVLVNCQFGPLLGNGILLESPLLDVMITGCMFTIEAGQTGISCAASGLVTIVNCQFGAASAGVGNGIILAATVASAQGVTITNCQFNVLDVGIGLTNTTMGVSFRGNIYNLCNTPVDDAGSNNISGVPVIQEFHTPGAGTYNPLSPAAIWLRVRIVGAGAGGRAAGNTGGTAGGDTTFAGWTAKGGQLDTIPGSGGANGPRGTQVARIRGGAGQAGSASGGPVVAGGGGGSSLLGCTQSTGGGGNGAPDTAQSGNGGGAGEYVEFVLPIGIPGSLNAIAYVVGTAGTNGTGAGSGGNGRIIIEEYY